MPRQVQDALSKNVLRVDASISVAEALAQSCEKNVSHVAVLTGGHCLGVSSFHDEGSLSVPQTSQHRQDPTPSVTISDTTSFDEMVRLFGNPEVDAQIVENAEGKFIGVITRQSLLEALQTDRKQLQQARANARTAEPHIPNEVLRESEEKYRTLVEWSPYCIHEIDLDGNFLSMNRAGLESIGETDETAIQGVSYLEFISDGDRERVSELMDAACAGEYSEFEFRSSSDMYFRANLAPVCDTSGTVSRLIGISQDITAQRRADQATIESNSRLQAILDTAIDYICVLDLEGNLVYLNRVGEGFSTEDAIGRSVYDFVPPDEQHILRDAIAYVTEHKRPHEYQLKAIDAKGGPAWYLCRMGPQIIDGQVKSLTVCTLDITERYLAEQAIREKQEQLDNVLSNVDAIILEADPFDFHFVGGRVEEILGYPKELWFEHPQGPLGFWSEKLHPEDTHVIESCVSAIRRGEDHSFEYRMIAKNGDIVWFYDSVRVDTRDGAPVKTRSIMIDITARKEAETAADLQRAELQRSNENLQQESEDHRRTGEMLRRREGRLRSVLAATFDAVIAIDKTGIIALANVAAQKMFGYEELELVGQNVNMLMPEPYRSEHGQYLQQYLETGVAKIIGIGREITCCRKDGTQFPADLAITQSDSDKDEITFIGTVRDISERKQAATTLLQKETELAHIARLSTMGEMATGIAHELNQPLGAISLYAGSCLHLLEEGDLEEIRSDLENISRVTQRCGDIIQRIRRFAKGRKSAYATIDITQPITDVLSFIQRDARLAGIEVCYARPDDPVLLVADSVQIEQVLLNLARNAIDAMTDIAGTDKSLSIEVIARPGEVEIQIRDTGEGIPFDLLDRICEPFVSTKDEGLGMGLSICRTIVESHQGSLELTSEPGSGTLARVILPAPTEASYDQ